MNKSTKTKTLVKKPPGLASRFLSHCLPASEKAEKLGDMEEGFNLKAIKNGLLLARLWYWVQIIKVILVFIKNSLYWSFIMFKNYLKTALRSIRRQKIYSAINILGLSIGIACSILIYFFVRNEMTYDAFHPDHDRIYRATLAVDFRGAMYFEYTPFPLADAIKEGMPGVEAATTLTRTNVYVVELNETSMQNALYITSPEFADMFDFSLERGSLKEALNDPSSVVISRNIKDNYFYDENPIGKTIAVTTSRGEKLQFAVAGVLRDIPDNSSISFDFLVSKRNLSKFYAESFLSVWQSKPFPNVTFIKAEEGVTRADLQSSIDAIAVANNVDNLWRSTNLEEKFPLQKITDIHFDRSITNNALQPAGDLFYAYIMTGVGIFILLIACINFMNLSVGLSSGRTKEVGMRKVLGAHRKQLIKQFWFESVLLSFFAFFFALLLAEILLPKFNELSGKALVLDYLSNIDTMFALAGLVLLVGFISGMYPAVILSGFKPIAIIRDAVTVGGKNYLTRFLVVFQFSLSIFLIAGTAIMSNQLNFIIGKDLGYNSELVIYQKLAEGITDSDFELYQQKALQHPGVVNAASTRASMLGDGHSTLWSIPFNGESLTIPSMKISYDYFDVMGISLLEGRNFSRDHITDGDRAIIVNEKFVETFELDDPVSKPAPLGQGANNPIIIGIVKDFHFQTLKKEIEPLILNLRPSSLNYEIFTKIHGENIDETLSYLSEAWNGINAKDSFDYSFFEENVERQYRADQNMKTISGFASYLGIIIAGMGLFGMTALSVSRRTREMGIRKVLGAQSSAILRLFNKEYLSLIVLANVIAWPATYYFMNIWLNGFAYKIQIEAGIFLVSAVVVIAIALVTITLQALKAVLANPVDTLRCE